MSIDRSLKLKGALVRHRNVLTRAERVERLKEEERWAEGDSLLGLPKVANRKVSVSKKKAEAKVEGEATVLDQAAAAQPAGTQGKGAAPAGKAAAPAGKVAAPAGTGKAAPASGKKTAGAGKAAPAAPSKAAPASKSTGQGKPGGGKR
jgi:small basic protein (TIGR04137 family)